MDDTFSRALISAVFDPNERHVHTLLKDYQPPEIVKLPTFKSRLRGRERNIYAMLECAFKHYTWLTPNSVHWPRHISRLAEQTPLGLWLSGDVTRLQRVGIAIVGSRQSSTYGTQISQQFAEVISSTTMTVVAGGASGIQEAAHRGALQQKGKTLCVLAGGLTHIYPSVNKRLFQIIEDEGLLISEVAPWRRAQRHWFLMRNRLIAGLSDALVVVEAAERCGALSCVTYANAIGIEVCVVPGSIQSPLSSGSHALIRDGATLVTSAKDIINIVLPSIELQRSQAQFTHEQSVQAISSAI